MSQLAKLSQLPVTWFPMLYTYQLQYARSVVRRSVSTKLVLTLGCRNNIAPPKMNIVSLSATLGGTMLAGRGHLKKEGN